MIGDNPKSDICGANAMGGRWKSILVRTGCFQSNAANDAEFPAFYVAPSVFEAIQMIIEQHQIGQSNNQQPRARIGSVVYGSVKPDDQIERESQRQGQQLIDDVTMLQ